MDTHTTPSTHHALPMARAALVLVITLLLLVLAGCGGGGGDTQAPPAQAPNEPPPTTPPPNALNAGFEGQLYFPAAVGDHTAYVELDLRSGVRSVVRGSGGASAAVDGSEFVAIESDNAELLDEEAHDTELVIFGRDGRARARFGRAGWMHGLPKLSPDGQRLAFEYSDGPGDPAGASILNITDREGRVLQRYEGIAWWDWHPGGGLVVAGGDAIYRIGAGLGAATLLRRFAGDRPTDLAISPDGSQLAFGLGDRNTLANHVWIMKLDGSALRQLTRSALNEDAPAWAPDGRHLAVRQGIPYAGLGAGIPGNTCPVVWLVPADATQANLSTGDTTTPARQLRMRGDDGQPRDVCAFGAPNWRLQAPALPSVAGTPAAGDGVNRGLSGRLVFDAADQMVSLDLATGTTSTLPGDGSAPFPTANGGEFAFHAADPDSGDSDDAQITVLRGDGSRAAAIQVAGFFLGGPKLSPDGSRIAARVWLDADSEPSVTVFDRSGAVLARAPAAYEVFGWMPDGRLLLAAKQAIGVTDAGLTVIAPLATLSDPVHALAAGPDGTRLALAMAGRIWLMNADGRALRQLTSSGSTQSAPSWSPDGRHVLLRHASSCPVLHAVPADGERVFIGHPSVPSTAWPVRQAEGGGLRDTCAFSTAHWR